MPARLPRPAGGLDPDTPFGPATNWVASPSWCVDHLLRNAGIHSCPPPRSGSVLYASMHGGAAPNLGYLLSLSGDWSRWTKVNAPWECAVQGSSAGTTKAEYAPQLRPVNRNQNGGGFWYEVWIDNTGVTSGDRTIDLSMSWVPPTAVTVYTTMRADFAKGEVKFFNGTNANPASNAATSWSVPELTKQYGRWHFGMWLTFSATGVPTVEGTVQYPGGSGIVLTPGTAGAAISAGSMGNAILRIGGMRVEALQVSLLRGKPPTFEEITQTGAWKKTATLDTPDLPIRVIPAVSGSAWDVITQIAKATLSTAGFDADGVFRWRNRSRWTTPPTKADVAVTSQRELASLTIGEEIDACRNNCSVKWANWARVKANKGTVKQSRAVYKLGPLSSYSLWWTIADDEFDTPPPFTMVSVGTDGIRFASDDTDTAGAVHGLVEVSTERRDGKLILTMYNRGYMDVWLRGQNGGLSVSMTTPSIDSGVTPSDCWSTYYNTPSQNAYGVQAYQHDPAGWVQDSASADQLAGSLRDAGAFPVPTLENVEVLPDPRIELGDVVRVQDSTGASLDTLAWVIGIRVTGDNGGTIRQVLTLRGTAYNGLPKDAGLTPDPPVDPNALVPQ
ncbi:hypothetical protein [Streptomyces platensis]